MIRLESEEMIFHRNQSQLEGTTKIMEALFSESRKNHL